VLIASIARRVQGLESLAHFAIIDGNLDGGACCVGCSTHLWDRVTPVELSDGGEVDQDATGDCSPLCRPCSRHLPSRIKASWPSGLTVADISAIWVAVAAEQARELECELERDRATALDDLQRASAAVEQARVHQGVDNGGASKSWCAMTTGSCDCLRCCDKSEAFWPYLAAVGLGAWICLSLGGYYVLALLVWRAFTTF